MIRPRYAFCSLVTALIAVASACAPSSPFAGPTATPLPLSRCDENPGILCLVTFGIQPPDQMLIAIRLALGGLDEVEAVVESNGQKRTYVCHASAELPRDFYCTGPQIPLGSRVRIEIFTPPSKTTLASGDFVLTAFALPTVPMGGLEAAGTAYPNP